ncbi:FkbM family methyltransferase [Streptomyces sp. NBC_01766]|uniref:FkbM family methyltransferase n=1 Tax=Streptomyces sp. NBC_01766 TaxID=2975936 RepID=UPI002DDB14EF|nr:FkbM family methyltransferase [Streptomyces sp. NBC_01766]WSC18892.1 FkbM family methyltransferase [Streptomyces sp. NBC_01766]
MTDLTTPVAPAADAEADRALTAAFRTHPAVLDADVLGPVRPVFGQALGAPDRTACLLPDPEAAALLHRAAALEAAGRLGRLSWHEPADDLLVAGVSRTETDFLYREIFTDNAYLRHGITLPDRAVVLDVGANIGMFTLRAALASPGARIVAVEPVAELAAAVALNAELYGLDVTVLNCALGSVTGESDFTYYPGNSVMSGRFAHPDEDVEVLRRYLVTGEEATQGPQLGRLAADRMTAEARRCEVSTLTRVIAEQRLERIDLLKIDVEKAEAEVLAGIDDASWSRIDRIAMEVHDLDGRLKELVSLLRDRGFEVSHDQDPRLVLTPCHNVYAYAPHRPARQLPPAPPNTAGRPGGPTLRVLERELRDLAARNAPGLAVPGRFAVVADLDEARRTAPTGDGGSPQLPSGPGTAVLAEIWTDIFGPGTVRPDANFFALGGNSLTAVRLLAQLEDRLGEDVLAPDTVFTADNFAEIAAALEAGLPPEESAGTPGGAPHPDRPGAR